jgi:hypothetical protein
LLVLRMLSRTLNTLATHFSTKVMIVR